MIKTKRGLLFVVGLVFLAIVYRYAPRRPVFLGHYDKVFAHRVNSLEKLEASLRYFKGVELDLVYDAVENTLDVNHPPAKSIGLNFKHYVSKIPNSETPFLWLDIKNLNVDNAAQILSSLENIFSEKKYPRSKVLIESRAPEALSIFTITGYKTSCFLPPNLLDVPAVTLKNIRQILKDQPTLGISANGIYYKVLKEYFPERTKYVWVLTGTFATDYATVRTILEDTTVAVVLSPYRSLFGNR